MLRENLLPYLLLEENGYCWIFGHLGVRLVVGKENTFLSCTKNISRMDLKF